MRVFISSKFGGLEQVRAEIHEALKRAFDGVADMQYFAARPDSPLDVCLHEVRDSDLVVLVVGAEYGSIPEGHEVSYTHLEFREAVAHDRPVAAIVLREAKESADPRIAEFIKEVADGRTVDFLDDDDNPATAALAALLRAVYQERVGSTRAFQTAQQFFAPFLDAAAVFSHTVPFVGREAVVEELVEALAGDVRVCALAGSGGAGKSRVLLELERRLSAGANARPVLFLAAPEAFTRRAMEEVPLEPCVVVADDAHRIADLEEFITTILTTRKDVRLVLSSRPAGADRITASLRSLPVTDRWSRNLEALTGDEAIELAKAALGAEFAHLAKGLAAAADSNPLIITVGSQLVREGVRPELLEQKDEFRRAALDRLLRDVPGSVGGGVPSMRLLEFLACVEPLNLDSRARGTEPQQRLAAL